MKKFNATILLFSLFITLVSSGCLKKSSDGNSEIPTVNLTFYGLYDNEDAYSAAIEAFAESNNVNVIYKKFTDPVAYLDLIINEMAEGEGPDIFMMHNTWFPQHYKKLTAAPDSVVTAEKFKEIFVEVAAKDLIFKDSTGVESVMGLPLYVDTLALYYNKDHFEDAIPSQGKPSDTWDGIKNDVTLLNRDDDSVERFERAGIAMGRSDNILRAFDIMAMLFIQYKTSFYDETLSSTTFGNDTNALSALDLYTSFALSNKKSYSWNEYLADADSSEKEITTFAKGQVSMILGYSYTYEDILNEISRLKQKKQVTIDSADVKIQEIPQVFDPETSAETREAYASYFVPVVSRTSTHSTEAWQFLANLVSEQNMTTYNQVTNKPTSRRSLISSQSQDPIYGVFASQVGYAESLYMADADSYSELFLSTIDAVLSGNRSSEALKNLASDINDLIPANGIKIP